MNLTVCLDRPPLLAMALLLGVMAGCDREKPADPVPAASVVRKQTQLQPETPAIEAGREIVAIVNGDSITADELDAPIRIRLYDLERLQYETRLKRLRALAIERILGPAAAAENLSLKAYVAREAEAFVFWVLEVSPERHLGKAAADAARLYRRDMNIIPKGCLVRHEFLLTRGSQGSHW